METSSHKYEPTSENATLIAFGTKKIADVVETVLTACPPQTRLKIIVVDGRLTVSAWSPFGLTKEMKEAGVVEW